MVHLYCRCGIDWLPTVNASVSEAGDTWSGRCEVCKLDFRAWAVAGPRQVQVRTHGFYPHVPKPQD